MPGILPDVPGMLFGVYVKNISSPSGNESVTLAAKPQISMWVSTEWTHRRARLPWNPPPLCLFLLEVAEVGVGPQVQLELGGPALQAPPHPSLVPWTCGLLSSAVLRSRPHPCCLPHCSFASSLIPSQHQLSERHSSGSTAGSWRVSSFFLSSAAVSSQRPRPRGGGWRAGGEGRNESRAVRSEHSVSSSWATGQLSLTNWSTPLLSVVFF